MRFTTRSTSQQIVKLRTPVCYHFPEIYYYISNIIFHCDSSRKLLAVRASSYGRNRISIISVHHIRKTHTHTHGSTQQNHPPSSHIICVYNFSRTRSETFVITVLSLTAFCDRLIRRTNRTHPPPKHTQTQTRKYTNKQSESRNSY